MPAAGLPFAAGRASPRRGGKRGTSKVIFVTHDDNPFFVPVRAGLEAVRAAGRLGDAVGRTAEARRGGDAAIPARRHRRQTGGRRLHPRQHHPVRRRHPRRRRKQGIFVILYNTASEGYQDLGVAYVGQEFIPAGIVSGLNAAKHAQEITGATTASSSWARSPPATARSMPAWRAPARGSRSTTRRTGPATRPRI